MTAQHYFERRTIHIGKDRKRFLSGPALAVFLIRLVAVTVTFGAVLLRVS